MKIDVHTFFDGYEGEEMAENTNCNKERIKELTMNKIYSEKKTTKVKTCQSEGNKKPEVRFYEYHVAVSG